MAAPEQSRRPIHECNLLHLRQTTRILWKKRIYRQKERHPHWHNRSGRQNQQSHGLGPISERRKNRFLSPCFARLQGSLTRPSDKPYNRSRSRCPFKCYLPMHKITYRNSGVDLETYQESMARLPRLLKQTHCPRVIPWDNGFAGLFRLDFAGKLFSRNYQEPILVAGTDGVGTKLKVAQMAGCHDTIGIDLVAMCVNDALCCGAEPLFFLDYVAMAEDDPARLEQLVTGISEGCLQSDAALIGGETAIMPGVYGPGDYDLAGFCVGIVENSRLLDGKAITARSHSLPGASVRDDTGRDEAGGGDTILGIASSGIHANGYSLVRKIVFEHAKRNLDETVPSCGQTVRELLLEPTRIYARPIRAVLNHYPVKSVVHGIAHITGGGLLENLSRILPPTVTAEIKRDSWTIPPVFPWLQQLGKIDESEMYRVFNMGIGLVLVVSEYYTKSIHQQLATSGLESWVIGRIVESSDNADQGKAIWAG